MNNIKIKKQFNTEKRIPYKLKLIDNFEHHNEEIATKYYEDFIEKSFYYWKLFKDNNKEKYTFQYKLDTYNFVIPLDFSYLKNPKIIKELNKKIKIEELFDDTKLHKSIIKYKPMTSKFFQYNEIFHKYKLLETNKKLDILELTNYKSLYFNDIYNYYKKKGNISNSSYDVFFFLRIVAHAYETPQSKLDTLEYIKKNQDINIFIVNEFFNRYMIENNTAKYDLIICNIVYALRTLLRPHFNIQLYFNQYVFSLFNLEGNGNMIINIMQIITKPLADLITMVSHFFEDTIIHPFEVHNKYNWSSVCIIHKNFKGISEKDKNKLLEMFDILYNYDYTSMKYNILKNKDRQKFVITKKIIPDFEYKYIDSFLNTKPSDKIYDKIREINTKIYIERNIFMDRLIKLKLMNKEQQDKNIKRYRKVQVVNSIFYAKKYGFEHIEFSNKNIDEIIAKIITDDMLYYNNSITYKFSHDNDMDYKHIAEINFNTKDKIDMIETLIEKNKQTLKHNISESKIYLLNNKKNTDNTHKKYFNHNDKISDLIQTISENYNTGEISYSWLIMYNIIDKFDLLPKKKIINTFHVSNSKLNDVKALNHYIKTKTKSKLKWYAYSSQDSNFTEKYNDIVFINKKPRSHMLNEENIKLYNKYTKNVDLMICNDNIYGLLERYRIETQLEQTVFILNNLQVGSNCVTKYYLPQIYPLQISMIYILYKSFDELYFYKDDVNPYSKEFYIIGKGYKGINKKILDKLYEKLNKDIYIVKNEYIIENYNDFFIKQLEYILNKLSNNYIFNIERQLHYNDNYDYITDKQIHLINKEIKERNKDWIKNLNLEKINQKDKL